MKTFYEWIMIGEKDNLIFEDSHKKLYREVVAKLRKAGFTFVRVANDAHDVWTKDGAEINVIRNIRSNPQIIFKQALREWKNQIAKNKEQQNKKVAST